MKTILLPFYHLGLGGVQTKIIDLANTLVSTNQYRVVVYLETHEKFDRSNELDPRVILIFCPNIFKQVIKRRFYYFLIYLIFRFRPGSIFVSLEKSAIFLLRARRLMPFLPGKIVVNVDTYLKDEQLYPSELITKFYQTADAVLAPSLAAEQDFRTRLQLSSPPLLYLPNWIEVSESKLKYHQKKRDILYAGRLEYQKNPLQLIKFMMRLHQKKEPATLSIYGEGTLLPKIQSAVKRESLGKTIHFYPTSHQIQHQLLETRFLLLVSRYEGMPLIGLEAMKNGCLILGLNVPGIQDLIVDEVTGFCKNSVEELVTAYLEICQDQLRQKQMAAAAFEYLKKNFDQKRRREVINLLTTTQE